MCGGPIETFKSIDMKKSLRISASFDKPDFLEDLVEKLAQRRNESGFGQIKIPKGLKAVETSSIEAYVSGDVTLSDLNDKNEANLIKMPFISCFFFTCVKEKRKDYDLAWAMSLS
jgi:hypothetical protein